MELELTRLLSSSPPMLARRSEAAAKWRSWTRPCIPKSVRVAVGVLPLVCACCRISQLQHGQAVGGCLPGTLHSRALLYLVQLHTPHFFATVQVPEDDGRHAADHGLLA